MKVILNQDVPNLGELGDIKDVAPGYARNYLLPRKYVLAYNKTAIGLFERRRAEIEALKERKRKDSMSLREKIEAEDIVVSVPAGVNGKLYGAVTNATVSDELLKKGIELDRKRIEVPGRSIKTTGNYKVLIRLYEKEEATLRLTVAGHEIKSEAKPEDETASQRRKERAARRRSEEAEPQTPEEQAAAFEAAVSAGRLN